MWLCIVAIGSMALWLWTLTLPVYVRFVLAEPGEQHSGMQCLLFGWLSALETIRSPAAGQPLPAQYQYHGPLIVWGDFSFAALAWYANPLWAWNLQRMLRGKLPSLALALASTILAAMALQPVYINFGDDHGIATASVPLAGAYLWVVAVTIPLAVSLAALMFRRRDRTAMAAPRTE
jgi:hypothetical protein